MKIDIRTKECVYITIGKTTFYIDDSTNEGLMQKWKENTNCNNCGCRMGIDCGEAEQDYNLIYCSEGCFKENKK
jgi:hypothetical protein|tara:strand:+ start:2004 stop:2225 length:222 start_codon:yes stop_codon:yes gene_type:complete